MYTKFCLVLKKKSLWGTRKKKISLSELHELAQDVLNELTETMSSKIPTRLRGIPLRRIYNERWMCDFHLEKNFDLQLEIIMTPLVMTNGNPSQGVGKVSWLQRRKTGDSLINRVISYFRSKGIYTEKLEITFHEDFGHPVGISGYMPNKTSIFKNTFTEYIGLPLLSTFVVGGYLYVTQSLSSAKYKPSEDVILSTIPLFTLLGFCALLAFWRITVSKEIVYELS